LDSALKSSCDSLVKNLPPISVSLRQDFCGAFFQLAFQFFQLACFGSNMGFGRKNLGRLQ
jgi:hypothetical protein